MRINPEQLSRHLQTQLTPLYTVFGDELLLTIEAADLIRTKARQSAYIEREIFTIDHHFNWGGLQQSSSSLSLFGERRIMDIRIPSGKPGISRQRGLSERIAVHCRLTPSRLSLLPKIDEQGSGTKWFRALENTGVMIPVFRVERTHLPAWIGSASRGCRGKKLPPIHCNFSPTRWRATCLQPTRKVKKLALLYPAGALSFNQVKDAVLDVARYDVFKLSNAMMAADTVRYIRILEGLAGRRVRRCHSLSLHSRDIFAR